MQWRELFSAAAGECLWLAACRSVQDRSSLSDHPSVVGVREEDAGECARRAAGLRLPGSAAVVRLKNGSFVSDYPTAIAVNEKHASVVLHTL
jgi:hypothetical protein